MTNGRTGETPTDGVLLKLDQALVVWGGYFRLVCGRCWTEAAVEDKGAMSRAKAVLRLYDRGWRCTDVALCPGCADAG